MSIKAINKSNKLSTYCTFKSLLEPERYISVISNRKLLTALAKFRCSNHTLSIEYGRSKNIDITERTCYYCQSIGIQIIEDEYHFLCKCPLYSNLRDRILPLMVKPTYFEFVTIMCSKEDVMINAVAKYVFLALIERSKLLLEN